MADDVDVYFAGEAFLIGVLQVVSGGALIAALSERDALLDVAGRTPSLMFVTLMGLALVAAVFAAFGSFRYKMYRMKANVARNDDERKHRNDRAGVYLTVTRWSAMTGTALIAGAVVFLLGGVWFYALCRPA